MANWAEQNRAHLWSEIERVGKLLDGEQRDATTWSGEDEPALVTLRKRFRLSPFEHDVIVMCAGHVLEPTFATKVPTLTLGLAIAKHPGAPLDATSPTAPLRLFRLVSLQTSNTPMHAPLALDERILDYLLGIASFDERLLPYLLPLRSRPAALTATQHGLARRIAAVLGRGEPGVVLQVVGCHPLTRLAVLEAATAATGIRLLRLRASALTLSPHDLEALQQICEREMILSSAMPVVEIDTLDGPEAVRAARSFAAGVSGAIVISASEPIAVAQASALFEVSRANAAERHVIWKDALSERADSLGWQVDRLAHQFQLDATDIFDVIRACDPDSSDEPIETQLWRLCRERSRPNVEDLARRIAPTATWDDLVVPANVLAPLRDIVAQLRHRHVVHERWGFARTGSRGQAITALFAGPSGTGKTLAAEVIARETELDLYHVDLSQVVDKYVGETEKRLRRIFDAAEAGGAILLFDEADALFGKRAQVERGTDRWANLEVSYLLQRMESYNGLAILTTNAKDALDTAFLRRLRFVVQFPFPDVHLRTELWRRAIPADAPRGSLDLGTLARLQLTGANIKSIAINAAFHAADEDSTLDMQHLLRAARSELAKLELPFPESDARRWERGANG